MVRSIDIQSEMEQSYLDYAMSVIVSRALPDARDGLKPVHRRILFALHEMGIRPDTPFRKSARIVGEVLGKYHPHGDMAVYDAMARLAQDFSVRYPLVEGQGNFGSIDGDPPAAMRYTEARMTEMAVDMLADIEKDTVDFDNNFDGSMKEPSVLPASVPNHLINGATGIAVGMSTSIPPHNLDEVVNALVHILENWTKRDEISLEDLLEFIEGPDFPTGGIILRDKKEGEGMISAYATGRGKITLQARAHFEEMGRGRTRIIVTELPYQTNKTNLLEKIADLARDGRLEGLTDLRDESDRRGMRIVLELAKSANPEKILSKLYKRTTMQGTFSMIMLALVDGQPRLLSLKQSLIVYLEHRHEIVRRRSEYDLAKAEDRAHVLEGLLTALDNLDEVIEIIRKSKDVPQARTRLQKGLELTEVQAQAILDMPLRRLANLEQKKIKQEHKEVVKRIKELKAILKSDKKMRQVIIDELKAVKDKYGDRRRTYIVGRGRAKSAAPLTASDLAPAKDTWVVLTKKGLLSRTTTARIPRISGRSAPELVIGANVQDRLFLFDGQGEGGALAVHTIPETDEQEKGTPFASLCGLPTDAEVVTGISVPEELFGDEEKESFLLFATREAMVKKSSLSEFPGPSAKSFQAVKINKGDELGWVGLTTGENEILLISSDGMAIRFSEEGVRPMGMSAAGVNGMKLEKGAHLVCMDVVRPGSFALMLSKDGRGKRTAIKQFPDQGRYGKGVLAWASDDEVMLVGAMLGEETDRATAVLSRKADRSIRIGDVARKGRTNAGVELFDMAKNDRVKKLQPILPRGVRIEK
ncbi:MAG: DNA gyrase subunit A [Anaerolineales bacterium]